MDSDQALTFAFDNPINPLMKHLCCTCGTAVRKKDRLRHMDDQHTGWLEAWNDTLRAEGLPM